MMRKIENIIIFTFLAGILVACDMQKPMYNESLTKDIFRSSDSKLVDSVASMDIYIIDKRCGWETENWLRKNNKAHKIIIDKEEMKQIISKLMYNKRPKENIPSPRMSGEELHIVLTMKSGSKAYIRIYGFKNRPNTVWAIETYPFSGYQAFPVKSIQEMFP